jgi:3-phenylpropionate/cinnamic acid dioxygenase small subunit
MNKTLAAMVIVISVAAMYFFFSASITERSARRDEMAALHMQVDALQAESEIRHRLQTYMPVLSAADWDTFVTYFTRDATLIMTEGNRQGRDDIKERMASAAERMAAAAAASGAPVRKRADLLSNVEVQLTSPATANAQSRFVFLGENAEGAFDVTGSGRYIDTWALEEGAWRIASREVDYDLLRSAPAPAPGAAQ